jgi:hypothetical protein
MTDGPVQLYLSGSPFQGGRPHRIDKNLDVKHFPQTVIAQYHYPSTRTTLAGFTVIVSFDLRQVR